MQQLETIDTPELQGLLAALPDSLPLFATDGSCYFLVKNLICRQLKEGLRHFCELSLEKCSGGKIVTQPVSALKTALSELDRYSHFVGSTDDGQTYRVLEVGSADLGGGPVVLCKIELSE